MRKRLTRRGSRRLFKATAQRVHSKNVRPVPMRGGIRL